MCDLNYYDFACTRCVDELAAEMLVKLPNKVDVETTERMMGPEIVMPMCVSLLQEIGYYNVLIGGQYLEGASWFRKDGHLQEPLPMMLVFGLTPIHFKPIRAGGRRLKMAVDLPAGKESPDFWVKRGTALLCTLAT
ncbi:hypothetical protein MSG28_006571 [Choristoneura fumiferana]|uniref:Uncharacterized protein n=1 Tax=Choristoneura fumiferana TaxID=7141 RepID=A0ACC0JFJ3_CHOFU|nr:hypothetical protein MSG28_006571 [Choristoneura fumiferana]